MLSFGLLGYLKAIASNVGNVLDCRFDLIPNISSSNDSCWERNKLQPHREDDHPEGATTLDDLIVLLNEMATLRKSRKWREACLRLNFKGSQ